MFQPHTFSRTKAFLDEFAECLNTADHTFLCEIFGSIRENSGNLTIQDLIDSGWNTAITSLSGYFFLAVSIVALISRGWCA